MKKLLGIMLGAALLFAAGTATAQEFGDWLAGSGVPAATAPYGSTDYVPIVQSTETRRFTGDLVGVQRLALGWPAAINPTKNILATVDQASTVRSIVGTVDTPVGTPATVTVRKAPIGTACPSGTALHSGSFDANASSGNQTLAVTTTSLSPGDRICLDTTGGANWTSGAGVGVITVRVTTP